MNPNPVRAAAFRGGAAGAVRSKMFFWPIVSLLAAAAVIYIKLWMRSHGADIHSGLAAAELGRKAAREHKRQAGLSTGRR